MCKCCPIVSFLTQNFDSAPSWDIFIASATTFTLIRWFIWHYLINVIFHSCSFSVLYRYQIWYHHILIKLLKIFTIVKVDTDFFDTYSKQFVQNGKMLVSISQGQPSLTILSPFKEVILIFNKCKSSVASRN